MTREEAIEYGKEQLEIFGEGCQHHEFIKMAISALEQNEKAAEWYKLFVEKLDEQEPCNDAISRYDVLKKREVLRDDNGTGYQCVRTAYIRELPSVQPKPIECENCSKCEDAFMRGHDVGLENGYKQGERDAMMVRSQKSDEQLYKNGFADGYEQGHKDAEQKPGKWIDADRWKCSECGRTVLWKEEYCPSCGAEMESEE